jgi:hypothetical protein
MQLRSNCHDETNLVKLRMNVTQQKQYSSRQSLLTVFIDIGESLNFNLLSMRLIACAVPVSKAN